MFKKIALALVLVLLPATLLAKRTTYIYTDNRFDFVKIEEVEHKLADKRNVNHPYKFTIEQIQGIFSSIKLHKSFVLSKKVEIQDLFDKASVEFFAPYLVEAFVKATVYDQVVLSNLVKDPRFVLRNDRLSIMSMWVSEDELHIKFAKFHAKLAGDYTQKGSVQRAANRAKGLGVKFDLQPNQFMMLGDELVVSLSGNVDTPKKDKKLKKENKKQEEIVKEADEGVSPDVAKDAKEPSVKERMKTLKELKDAGLITDEEYKTKKEAILKDI